MQKIMNRFFGKAQHVPSNNQLGFGSDVDCDLDPGIFKMIIHLLLRIGPSVSSLFLFVCRPSTCIVSCNIVIFIMGGQFTEPLGSSGSLPLLLLLV